MELGRRVGGWKLFFVVLALSLFLSSVVFAATSRGDGDGGQPERPCRSSQTCLEIDTVWSSLLNVVGFDSISSNDRYWKSHAGNADDELMKGEWVQHDVKYPGDVEEEEEIEGEVDYDMDDVSSSPASIGFIEGSGDVGDCSYLDDRTLDYANYLIDLTVVDRRKSFCENTNMIDHTRYRMQNNERVINTVVLHYTAGSSVNGAIGAWEGSRQASAHYIIDKDGTIYYVVDEQDVAWHVVGSNANSIGIELVNLGSDCRGQECLTLDLNSYQFDDRVQEDSQWEAYPAAQMETLYLLTAYLDKKYDGVIAVGHEDLDGRTDPGPAFDWDTYTIQVNELLN